MKLYLAHPRAERKQIREWELNFEKRTGIELVNPFYDVKDRAVPELDSLSDGEILDKAYREFQKIVRVDLREILMSDGIVARLIGNDLCGTYMEMVNAAMMKRPVYSLVENGKEKHSWINYYSNRLFTKLNELESFLISKNNALHKA